LNADTRHALLKLEEMATMDAMSQDPEATESAFDDSPERPALLLLPDQHPAPPQTPGIAPIWHTLLLILAILAYSIWGAVRSGSGNANPLAPVHSAVHASADGSDPVRLIRYGLSGALELFVVAWVALGLRLRKVPFRSLFGAWPGGLNDITKEAGIAAAFWICSMIILASLAVSWAVVQTKIYEHRTANQSGNTSGSAPQKSPQQQQVEMARQLMDLAPANNIEIAAWGLLCLTVGFSEELIFRGYLQSQSIALLRSVPISVVLTALVFGAAHGYQGVRGIVLISVYGALFSCITLLRKNLFPGMLAHTWHDFATGMLLALMRSTHLLDHLPTSS
jgi:membrane protease YdiL (CAAX protease family)